jgi:hypothetical protein
MIAHHRVVPHPQASVTERPVALPPGRFRGPINAIRQSQRREARRDRAAEMRALSDMMSDLEPKAIMLRLAEDYDRLADKAQEIRPH